MIAVAVVCALYALGMVGSCAAMIVGHVRGQRQLRNTAAALARASRVGCAVSGYGVSLEALSGIAHAVRSGWGEYGYRVHTITGALDGSAIAEVSASDGSRFFVASDLYGVVIGQGFDSADEARAALHAHHLAMR